MLDFISIVKNNLNEQNKTIDNLFKDNVISKNTFYKYKQRFPNLKTLIKIANYLKVSIDYLLELKDENCFKNFYVYNKDVFYKNLIFFIQNKKISCRKLCKDLNYSKDNIYRWKKGVIPSIRNLIELAKYFDCYIDDLLL